MKWLDGKTTHLTAVGIVLTGVGGFLTGEMTLVQAIGVALGGAGLSRLRTGVAKSGPGR
jgi:hypothetical protein